MIDPMVKLANMFSYIKENQRGKAMIHNLIFEDALFVYFGNKTMREQGTRISPYVLNYVQNGKLNMEHVVTRFRDQLSNYLAIRGMDEGYLVTFDFSKKHRNSTNCETQLDSMQDPQWIEWNGKRIFEVIV